METNSFRVRGFHPLRPAFPEPFRYELIFFNSAGHPHAALQPPLNAVWALPLSLAATCGISNVRFLFLRVT